METYKAPKSRTAIKRNHKICKKVHSTLRSRIRKGKVEKHVAVARKNLYLEKEVHFKRFGFENVLAVCESTDVQTSQIGIVLGADGEEKAI